LLYFSKILYENDRFTLPVSHYELAALIGTTRESVTRTLSKFKSDGIIQIKERNITILNNELLENNGNSGRNQKRGICIKFHKKDLSKKA
jgi:hypothetical protein